MQHESKLPSALSPILPRSVDSGSGIPSSGIQECPSYNYTDPVRPGCDLEADIHQTIYIFFNATLMDTVARNTFSKDTLDDGMQPVECQRISTMDPTMETFW